MYDQFGSSLAAGAESAIAEMSAELRGRGRPLRVLVGAADPFSRRALEIGLRERGLEVSVGRNGHETLDILESDDPPDIAVLDTESEGIGGIDLCARVRRSRGDAYTYTLLLVPADDGNAVVMGLQAGADDSIAKPFNQPELLARIEAGCRIVRHQRQLQAMKDEYLRRSTRDGLTSLLNRTTILSHLSRELSRSRRKGSSLGVMMLDVDEFKSINDRFGHQVGDAVLRAVSKAIVDVVRPYDSVGRYGGEEFLVVLPECDLEEAQSVAERIRSAVSAAPISWGGTGVSVTISIGVAAASPPAHIDLERLVRCADAAMYRAKEAGRNRVEQAQETVVSLPSEIPFNRAVGA